MTTAVSRVESDTNKVQVLVNQSSQGCGTAPGGGPKAGNPSPIPGKK